MKKRIIVSIGINTGLSIRINRYLALCGLGSRRSVETLIRNGQVFVNGRAVDQFSLRIHPGTDVVELIRDGSRRQVMPGPLRHIVLKLHKPVRTIVSREKPQGGLRSVYELIPRHFRPLMYIGRLDAMTTGLLLFSSDGHLVHRLTHPSYQVEKHYVVETVAPVGDIEREKLGHLRIRIGKRLTQPMQIARISEHRHRINVTLREGRNREIRRLFASTGIGVRRLHRVSLGPVQLGNLPPGKFKICSEREVRALYRIVSLPV